MISAGSIEREVASPGGNRRFVIRLAADGAVVESVLYRGDTLCVSSQVGCGVRCPFCASGAHGVARSLGLEELLAQRALVEARMDRLLARVALSGSGEPLHNHEAVSAFVELCRERTPASLTTTGAPLHHLARWLAPDGPRHNGLTISVHAGTEATRARLVPKGPALAPLFALLAERIPQTSGRRRKKTALAYLVIAGENDGDEELAAFAALARPLRLFVHLYAYNAVPTSAHRGVDRPRYEAIYARLVREGLRVRMSSEARTEDNGGCGTLVAVRGLTAHRDGAPGHERATVHDDEDACATS
ncbi:MAG: radical SAM protein [Sandaracinaceae bacterium]|nr:radical SAM protein [Sandaracinaceae bacterium]